MPLKCNLAQCAFVTIRSTFGQIPDIPLTKKCDLIFWVFRLLDSCANLTSKLGEKHI